jgi:hypothetical protein
MSCTQLNSDMCPFLSSYPLFLTICLQESLPETPLQGILNNRGDKVRLTFKVALFFIFLRLALALAYLALALALAYASHSHPYSHTLRIRTRIPSHSHSHSHTLAPVLAALSPHSHRTLPAFSPHSHRTLPSHLPELTLLELTLL